MNSVVLIGRMVADPELKYTPSGVAVCSFRLAIDRKFKSESGEKQADFINIVTWRNSAEFVATYLGKGRLVAIQGRLQSKSWVQTDGQKRSTLEVVADHVQGLDRGKEEPAGQHNPGHVPNDDTESDYDPFEGD